VFRFRFDRFLLDNRRLLNRLFLDGDRLFEAVERPRGRLVREGFRLDELVQQSRLGLGLLYPSLEGANTRLSPDLGGPASASSSVSFFTCRAL